MRNCHCKFLAVGYYKLVRRFARQYTNVYRTLYLTVVIAERPTSR